MPYQKNDYVKVTIEDMGSEGEGIGKVDGFAFFVKDAVIGDVVEAKVVKSKKNYAYARLEKIIQPSPFRVEPKCRCHRQCGGCQLQALSYEKQLEFKQRKIRNHLIHIGGFDAALVDAHMEPIVGMEYPYHYRNKGQYPVGVDKNDNIVIGFYAGRTHTIIPNIDCCLGRPENEAILNAILAYMRENRVSAYDEAVGQGLVRHILIRTGFASGEIMVCLVINACKFLPEQEDLLRRLSQIKNMTSVSVSINTEQTNVIMGREIHTIWGEPAISDTLHVRGIGADGRPDAGRELTFKISPLSFYQVNPVQTEKLYAAALEYAQLTGKETVWDLYCGIGTISLFLAAGAKWVYGVESVPQAVEDARENARRNHISNVEFLLGKAEEALPQFYEEKSGSNMEMRHPDVIVVDPPRKGCDEACLAMMLKMRPERIVYISCDSATLARDLRILCDGGYGIRRIRGFDQFAQGVHVETIVCLGREFDKSKEHVCPDYALSAGEGRCH